MDTDADRGTGKGTEVVVITGASAGVGRAVACRFAATGAHVALLARGEAGLLGARQDVEARGGTALPIVCDVADAAAVEQAAARVEAELGPIDIWINSAMVTVLGEFLDLTPEEFERVTQVTYLGYVHGTRAALRRMMPRDRGTIVQVGSALAYRGIPLQAAYCGAKHAIQGFTESVRCELLHRRSRVWLTMVQMPALNTPQFGWCRSKMPRKPQPVPPIYQPEVAADAVHWAAHHRRRELYVGGSTAVVIAGDKLLPSLGDWYLGRTGYDSQQYDGARDPGVRDNLFHPVDDVVDHGPAGAFGARAHGRSLELWAARHRGLLAALTGGVAAFVAGMAMRRAR
jgi:NAD(P)-dependent dehydrogenase (short-subunit alcohol dehydrogenase family)